MNIPGRQISHFLQSGTDNLCNAILFQFFHRCNTEGWSIGNGRNIAQIMAVHHFIDAHINAVNLVAADDNGIAATGIVGCKGILFLGLFHGQHLPGVEPGQTQALLQQIVPDIIGKRP